MTIRGTAWDKHQQALPFQIGVQVQELSDDWRTRALVPTALRGEKADPIMHQIERAQDGSWWGIDDDGALWRSDAGWQSWQPVELPKELRVGSVQRLQLRRPG